MRGDLLTKNQDKKYGGSSSTQNPTARQLQGIENQGTEAQPDFYRGSHVASDRGRFDAGIGSRGTSDVLENMEGVGNFVKPIDSPVTHRGKPAQLWNMVTSKKVRGKASLFTVIALLFGGGGFLTIMFAPASAIVQMKEIFTQSLNDQVKALDSRSASIMRSKFKSTTTGSCGLVKIKCAMGEMTDDEARDFEKKNPKLKVNRTDIVDGKGKIASIVFSEDGKDPVVIRDANAFSDTLKNNEGFRTAWSTEYSPVYKSVSDPKAREVLAKDKLSKNYDLDGQNDEERQKKLNSVVANEEDVGGKNLTKRTDENGKVSYVDDDGKVYSQAEVDSMSKVSDNIGALQKVGGGAAVLAGTAQKAIAVDSVAENACSTWNFLRVTSALAKVKQKAQAMRYALALILTPADKIKANQATEDAINFSGNTIMKTATEGQTIDDSRLNQDYSGSIPTTDLDKNSNGFDAKGYRDEAYNENGKMTSRASRFALTGGSASILDAIKTKVATVVNGGNPDPKQVSKKCGYVQNNFVRVGAFGVGLAIGAATFGAWTIAQGTVSVAWALAQASLEAKFGDILNGNVFDGIYGEDSVNAVRVGTGGIMSDMAQARGMAPVTDQAGIDYINQNRQTAALYNQDQQYLARATPFDINNRFSFLGSMLFAMTPTILESRSNASLAMMNVASFIPTTFASISQPAKAADGLPSDYFSSCPDSIDESAGIKTDPWCIPRYYMPENSLALDPLENAQWMSDSGNIDPDTDTGEAKDNGQSWNYVKFLAECANRTKPYGENENENDGDGTECYSKENEEVNKHFRTYTMDLSVHNGMRDQHKSSPITTGAGDSAKGKVGPNGWAFPTVASDTIVRQFGNGFTGVDLAGSSVALTNQQPIYAAKDGTVVAAGKAEGYGNWIVVQHPADASGKGYYTVYGNLDDDGVLVQVNQKVNAGDQIGKIGSANTLNGPHLRFEVWDGSPLASGTAIDPTAIVEGARPATALKVGG